MWLITTLGYFSIVKKQHNPEDPAFQVRARVYADLENINRLMGTDYRIIKTYNSDYPYRILITSEELSQLFLLFARTIDYRSFKEEVFKSEEHQERFLTYHDVWSSLQKI